MFIISVDGGLGNQMFEYAFFLSMKSHYKDSKVYLDTSFLGETVHNGYELERVFGIKAPMAQTEDIIKYSEYCPKYAKHSKIINGLNKIRRCVAGVKLSYIVQEDSSAYYEDYYHLNALYSYYLRGVWANTKYFSEIKTPLSEVFLFPAMTDKDNLLLEREIQSSESVGIHFRKGDYAEFGFQILDKEYYTKAIERLNERIINPQYYIFSDDISSAREVIEEKSNVVFVEGNAFADSFADMKLMSLCKHNIIANSTFSFWGAYLNANDGKIVIYPKEPLKGCGYPYAEDGWIGI